MVLDEGVLKNGGRYYWIYAFMLISLLSGQELYDYMSSLVWGRSVGNGFNKAHRILADYLHETPKFINLKSDGML